MANVRTSYSTAQRALHWLTASLVFFNLLLPGPIEHVVDMLDDGQVPSSDAMFSAHLHIYAGFAILGITLLRLILRIAQGAPGRPQGEPDVFHRVAQVSHAAFYVVLLLMPILGIAKYFLGIDPAGDLHAGPVKVLLWALIALHMGAVLVHQFWWKTNALTRMTRG